ncbi:MAG: HAMP domain-containing protein [Deltaproteobacteria bacterium]|nr:HAMP domain-containing protein [Deltaproteobacteria bacterium]MBF0524158.1 HAMP domain-containing protein [Deltaproteobacteria bacterium]
MKNHSSLERKMLSYFGLIAAASLFITFEFVWAIRQATPQIETSVQGSIASRSKSLISVRQRMETLREKALLMCAVQAMITLIVLIMFMRRITGPLQQMVDEAELISDGDLSRTIQVRTGDEIGLIGETINGLTCNLQEVVALGLGTESCIRQPLAQLSQKLSADPEARELLCDIEAALDNFRDIVQGFKLLPPPSGLAPEDQV